MPKWSKEDLSELEAILQQIEDDLRPLPGKDILVLCCGAGEVALRLGKRIGNGKVVGLDLSDELLQRAEESAQVEGLERIVQFQKAEKHRLPFPDETFDALVSEFIVYPAPLITEIGQPEMARVLKPGGKMILTDVIVTRPLTEETREVLRSIGLDYLCEATQDDFRTWMKDAGLVNIEVLDFTPLLRRVWKRRQSRDPSPGHQIGYFTLLEDLALRLEEAIFYIYVRGEKEAKR